MRFAVLSVLQFSALCWNLLVNNILNLHSTYFVLLLLRQKSCTEVCLHVRNFQLISSLIFQLKLYHLDKKHILWHHF